MMRKNWFKILTSFVLVFVIAVGDVHAFTWVIQSPTSGTQYALTATVSVAGMTDEANVGFTAEVYDEWSLPRQVVMNSAAGTSTNVAFTASVPPPSSNWTITTHAAAVKVTSSTGANCNQSVKFIP